MGNQISQVTPSASTVGIDSYVDELGDIQYDKTCGSARFMKTVRGRHKDGLVIVKIFIKPTASLGLRSFQKQLTSERNALLEVSHVVPYSIIMETERAGYLVRQYFGDTLYDRISTRPFLENIEKCWIAYQLLSGLDRCHRRGVHHGDIKTENAVVTSWNWVYLTDFASFKPTFLPEDDPADFSFYFDTSLRRVCYVAPERFCGPDENKRGPLTDAMDIFSLGCVIAELFLDGAPIFTLSQLFAFRRGQYTPDLSKIVDPEIRSLILHMISLDPTHRFSADAYLNEWRDKAFPGYFYNFLHEYVQSITEPSVLRLGQKSLAAQSVEADFRIERIYSDCDKIAYFLGFDIPNIRNSDKILRGERYTDPFPVYLDIPNYHTSVPVETRKPLEDSGALIFLAIVVSAIRNTATATARLHACDLILAFGEQLPDEAKLDRCLPYLFALIKDDFVNVRIAALRSLTQILSLVKRISPVNEGIFPKYLIPQFQNLLQGREVFLRANYASCISTLAETALRFLDMSQEALKTGTILFPKADEETEEGVSSRIRQQNLYNVHRRELVDQFQDQAISLLTDPEPAVKRALLRTISPLCAFFGGQKASEIILSHLITYLNDKDALLRGAFFDGIIGLATFVGGNSLEEYIMPLMVQALADTEEFVIEKVLHAFTSLAELGLIRRPSIWDLVRIIVRFSVHPNLWIREGVFSFISATTKWLSPADVHCIIRPIVKPFLRCEILDYSDVMLQDFCKLPLSRIIFNTAIAWASESRESNFWKPAKEQRMSDIVPLFDGSYSITSSLHNLAITKASHLENGFLEKTSKTEEDAAWLRKLKIMGLQEDDLWKLTALREHMWRIAEANNNSRLVVTHKQFPKDIDMDRTISVNKLNIPLHTYFFDGKRTNIRQQPRKLPVSESTIKEYKAATALMDALKTIDSYQRRSPASLTLKKTEIPPHWLNGVEGSPRTMAPIFHVGSPRRTSTASIFMTSPSRVQTNGSTVTRVNTAGSDTAASKDGEDAAAAAAAIVTLSPAGEDLERHVTTSHELRRRASVVTFMTRREQNTGKTTPDVSADNTVVYGQLDKPFDKTDQATPTKKSARSANGAVYTANEISNRSKIIAHDFTDNADEDTSKEQQFVFRGHSYMGDDPYILKLLDTVYVEKFMEDIPEFGPQIPLAARPRALVRHSTGQTPNFGPWRPDRVLIAHFEEHNGPINRVIVSPDHLFFLTGSDDGTIRVWDSLQLERNVTNRSRQVFKQGAKVRCMCFIESTYCFASGDVSGLVNILKVDYSSPVVSRGIAKYGKITILKSYQLDDGEFAVWIEHAKIQSGSILIIATNKSRIIGLNLRTMRRDFVFENPLYHGVVTSFCVDRSREWLVVGTSRGILDLWSIHYQIRLKAWGLRAGTPIHRVSMHPTQGRGRWICVAGGTNVNGDEITVWDVEKTVCREVYRTSSDADTDFANDKRYEPVEVDDDPPEVILARFASDPVQLLERTEASIAKGIRSFCIGAADFGATYISESGFMSDTSVRQAASTFIISVGADRCIRYWGNGKAEYSCVVSSPDVGQTRSTYTVSNPRPSLSITSEVTRSTDIFRIPQSTTSSISSQEEASPPRRSTLTRALPPPPAIQTKRNTLVTPEQQGVLRNHTDTILDVALLCRPYGLIVTADRNGRLKVFA
ncbi:hypothetical protein V1512DRAFT_264820 [Lipomyces arxii]|uniref:uncharacterized protein n=1 Tax=Lipomyces arxii TaxID=56418 RepID=UPI0034CF1051